MAIRRKYVEVRERVETKYVCFTDASGVEQRIVFDGNTKIPEGCQITRWVREQEMKRYRMPIEKFLALAELI